MSPTRNWKLSLAFYDLSLPIAEGLFNSSGDLGSMSTILVKFNYKSMAYLNFGRTSQIRTGDLYHVKARTTRHDTLGHVEKYHALSGI